MTDLRTARSQLERPLSPHLQIYRYTWTMAMSIAHRITGGALYFGTILLAAWLIAAAWSPEAFATVSGIAGSWIGLLVLIGFSWALFHHAIGGIRHIVWDMGRALDRQSRTLWAQATLGGSLALTALLWLAIWLTR